MERFRSQRTFTTIAQRVRHSTYSAGTKKRWLFWERGNVAIMIESGGYELGRWG